MNLNDLNSRVDSSRRDAARINRTAANANPEYDAGMEDDMNDFFGSDDDDDFGGGGFPDFGGSSTSQSPDFGAQPFGAQPFGAQPFGSNTAPIGFGFADMGGTTQPQQSNNSEDKLFDAASKMGKTSVNMFKDLIGSFKSFNAEKRATTGRFAMIISGVCIFCAVLLLLFGRSDFGFELLIGSMTSEAVGILLLCFAQSSISDNKPSVQGQPMPQPMPEPEPESEPESQSVLDDDFFGGGSSDSAPVSDDFFNSFPTTNTAEPEKSEFTDDFSWADAESASANNDNFESSTEENDLEAARANLDNLPDRGIIDRRTLFERANSVLGFINKNFGAHTEISQNSELFNTLDTIVQDSAENFRTNANDELPYLISAVDTLFYIRLDIHRVKYIKNIDAYTKEIVSIFQYDRNTGKRDERIYGIGDTVGNEIHIKLMKGESVMVSLRDIYATREKDILDLDNKMPVVMGIDIEGEPVIRDFKQFNSLLVTGAPRTGKSWFLQAIIWQMMMYYSPDELWFYYFDPKKDLSDFKTAITPHVKKFVTSDDNIIAQLEYIVKVEGPRRKKQIGDAGCVNLDDYKKKYPNNDMPYLYVMIDEVVTLAERMDKDAKANFQGLLMELVSQLPATGIRLFMVPHLVKDNIIKKNITSLIPCRVSVMGNAEHIESSCGVKNFPHPLINKGDTCTVLTGEPKPLFIHGVVLSQSNDENLELFNYLAELWAKICPNSVAGSVYERRLQGKSIFDDDLGVKASSSDFEINANPRATLSQDTIINQEPNIMLHNNNILNNPVEEIDLFDDD